MYYEVLLNGELLGVYGHPNVRNMDVSVQITVERGAELFASGVCAEPDGLYMYKWLQQLIALEDVVTIKATSTTSSSPPIHRYKMRSVSAT